MIGGAILGIFLIFYVLGKKGTWARINKMGLPLHFKYLSKIESLGHILVSRMMIIRLVDFSSTKKNAFYSVQKWQFNLPLAHKQMAVLCTMQLIT